MKEGASGFFQSNSLIPMRMRRGEDIEHYADKYEERQEVLRALHEDTDNPKGSFPEEDERESRKTLAQQRSIY